MSAASVPAKTRIWDLPTRLFHWLLAGLVVFSVITAKIGGNALDYHMWSGYTILALLVFRILWGVAGDYHACFASFVRGPRHVLAYAGDLLRGRAAGHAGHNPLGAWSVIALLAALLVQASAGLFATDDAFQQGPLNKLVSDATATILTRIHLFNQYVIYALVALHLAAIVYYLVAKRDNLIVPMITGDKPSAAFRRAADDLAVRVRALILAALAAALVIYVVRL